MLLSSFFLDNSIFATNFDLEFLSNIPFSEIFKLKSKTRFSFPFVSSFGRLYYFFLFFRVSITICINRFARMFEIVSPSRRSGCHCTAMIKGFLSGLIHSKDSTSPSSANDEGFVSSANFFIP